MNITAEILEHTVTEFGAEAISWRLRFPRIILAEFATHRTFSKNTSSSRAIPITKMIKHVYDNMFLPSYWGKNQPGMQANSELDGPRLDLAKLTWKVAGKIACGLAWTMNKIGVHKQITNRLIENFSYVTVIMTTTDMKNFLALRNHKDAQPEIHLLATLMEHQYSRSTPRLLKEDEWHLPLLTQDERQAFTIDEQIMISAARCASTSYQTVDGKEITLAAAKNIFDKLTKNTPIHASPFEHQLKPDRLVEIDWRVAGSKKKYQSTKVWANPHLHGNTVGFIQNRKQISGESVSNNQHNFLIVG